jgi:oxygen-independent coproporphyrinogen-3 oxidase
MKFPIGHFRVWKANTTSYWTGEKYYGFGPSAHSYDGMATRRWNIPNLHKYIKGMAGRNSWYETEYLSEKDLFNEFVMTRLRTREGIPNDTLKRKFPSFYDHFVKTASELANAGKLVFSGEYWHIPKEAKFLTDGIIEEFFVV